MTAKQIAIDAYERLCVLTNTKPSLIWSEEKTNTLGLCEDNKLTLYTDSLRHDAKNVDPLHLPNIPMPLKQKMLWVEALTHEFAHHILNERVYEHGRVNVKESAALTKVMTRIPKEQRSLIVQNTSVLNTTDAIAYLSGSENIIEGPLPEDKALNETLQAHEFTAHLVSQYLMSVVGQEWQSTDNTELQQIGAFRMRAYNGCKNYLKGLGIQGLNALQLLHQIETAGVEKSPHPLEV